METAPRRRAAPGRPDALPYAKGALLITLALSLAFPMLGIALLVVMALDVVLLAPIPALRRAFS